MAAALLSRIPSNPTTKLIVESTGIAALEGEPAAPLAVKLMQEQGIDISAHRARQLTPQIGSAFELILVMEACHVDAVEEIFPAARGRVHRLGRFGNFDIPDPYRKPRSAFEHSLSLIERGIDDYIRAFWSAK